LASWRFNDEEPTAKCAKNAKQSEKPTDQTAILRVILSVKAATPNKIFVLLSPKIFFFVQDLQKPDSQVADLEALSHF
jgi:hypothetical protein